MLRTVKDTCVVHSMALDSALSEQIENLTSINEKTEKETEAFFSQNYVTKGMATLLEDAFKRLAGKSEQSVFELKQAMGGGKTHSMVALGLLAKNPVLRKSVVPEFCANAPFEAAKVVTIYGRLNFDEHFIWGEIASQLGKAEQFAKFWQHGAKAPDENDWVALLGDEPVLILMDELPTYMDYAQTQTVGSGTLAQVTTRALANLMSAQKPLKHCCLVISNLSGSYESASRELSKVMKNLVDESDRQAKPITPVELASDEIYEILRKRLFIKIPDKAAIDDVAAAYTKALSEAVRSKSIAKSAEQISDEIYHSYPFHPSVKQVISLFRENEGYNQTRGLMRFISKMIRSVWERPQNDVYLIGCQHLNLNISDVREVVNQINDLQNAIANDIAANGTAVAEVVDSHLNSDAGSQVATLLLTASLSEAVDAIKGLNKQEMLECLVAPNRPAMEFQEAFEGIRADAWFLHRKENEAFYFSKVENLRKRIDTCAKKAPQPKIDKIMQERLNAFFVPQHKVAYQEVHALPKIEDIRLNGQRVCMVLSPDSKGPPEEAQKFWESVTEKNNFCVVTGDGSSLGSLEDKTRRVWAIEKVKSDTGGDKSPHKAELEEEAEQAEQDYNSTVGSLFNRVYYPTKDGLKAAKLAMHFPGNQLRGEEQVQKALADIGTLKLYSSLDGNAEVLMTRAEEMLWPGGTERRTPWRDVVRKSVENPRWPWLPQKGLESLKTTAVGQGRWRWSEDGYIEKGPFPPPKTAVTISERDYNEKTGEARIEVLIKDAGQHGRVYYGPSPDVSKSNEVVPDAIFKTMETRLYFIAIDPDGEHETGEVATWSNKITLTHELQEISGKRIVTLSAVPRGMIRWNIDARNPKDGKIYDGPIELEGDNEVTIYAYAEDNGVSADRRFKIPKPNHGGFFIEPTKPAKLNPQNKDKLKFKTNADSFAAINTTKSMNAKVGGVTVEIGEGSRNVTTRFGSDHILSPEHLEQLIATLRQSIGDETSEARINFRDIHFLSGHDLEEFCKRLNIQNVQAAEVEQ